MHFSIPLTLSFLATTLALPTAHDTVSLEKRMQYGWIGSFDASNCQGHQEGPRPEFSGNHWIQWTNATNSIGISFGTGDPQHCESGLSYFETKLIVRLSAIELI